MEHQPENPHQEQESVPVNLYEEMAVDILFFKRDLESYSPEERSAHQEELEERMRKIRDQESLLHQALQSKESFIRILDALAELASNQVPYGDPVASDAAKFAGEFIQKHIDTLENIIHEGVNRESWTDVRDAGAAIRAIRNLIEAGERQGVVEFYELGLERLIRNFDGIESAIRSEIDDPYNYGNKANSYSYALEPLFKQFLRPDIRTRVAVLTAQQFAEQLRQYGVVSGAIEDTKNLIIRGLMRRHTLDRVTPEDLFLQEVFKVYGVSPNEMYRAWQSGYNQGSLSDFRFIVRDNLETMGQIESFSYSHGPQNALKSLHDEFGIRNFGRYPERVLTNQVDFADRVGASYGIVINPTDDHNGAFYANHRVYQELFNQLGALEGGRMLLRIIEVGNKRELGRRILQLVQKYGPAEFGILGGHGTGSRIRFGEGENMYMLDAEDLSGAGVQRGGKMLFKEGATIVLNSCSAGMEEGIGKKMSETFGFTFIGPDKADALKSVKVEMRDGKPHVSAEYYEESSSRTYSATV